jgi:hypothetical protein
LTQRWATTRRRAAAVVALLVVGLGVVAVSATRTGEAEAADRPASSTSTTAAAVTATSATPRTAAPGPDLLARVLTPDGGDAYSLAEEGGSAVVRASRRNQGGNLRIVAVDPSDPASTDHQVCVTWDGPLEDLVQPGLALRVRDRDGATQALTVTNNVFGASRWVWNVHAWLHPRVWRLASVELPGALFQSAETIAPLPWHMCAEVRGRHLRFVVWTGDGPAPEWDDPLHAAAIDLPAGWTFPGRAGFYAGHLLAGTSTAFRDLATTDLEGWDGLRRRAAP